MEWSLDWVEFGVNVILVFIILCLYEFVFRKWVIKE